MSDEFRIVDIWVGRFPSKPALEEYLQETYTEDDDDAPISKFAEDLGQSFYDHDFLESAYHEEPSSDLKALLADHSFASSYTPPALASYQQLAPGAINTVLLVWGQEIDSPTSVQGDGYDLHYLGRFECDPKA